MKVGYLGVGAIASDVAFEVSDQTIETFSGMKVTKQANYSTHKIHGGKAIPEMTGMDADTVSFDICLSAYLGVNPAREIKKLEDFMKAGTIVDLVLGDVLFGSWVIKSIPFNVEYTYRDGTVTQAKLTVSLIECDPKWGGTIAESEGIGTAAVATKTTQSDAQRQKALQEKIRQQNAARLRAQQQAMEAAKTATRKG